MEEFPYYGLSWFIYLIASGLFLYLAYRKTRPFDFWIRTPILSFIAAMALTPATTMQAEAWWSPAAIVMVFEIDQNGFAGFWRAGLAIIIFWLFLMLVTALGRWWLKRKQTATDTENVAQNELKEPK